MKYKTEILALFNQSQQELNKVITSFERESDYAHIAQEICIVLRLLHRADDLLIKHHLEECVSQLLVQRKVDEGVKQIIFSHKYLHKKGI